MQNLFKLRVPVTVSGRFRVGLLVLCVSALAAHAEQARSRVPAQPVLSSREVPVLSERGLSFRDLNRNGTLDNYEDWRLPAPARALDLLARMTLPEKVGAMMHGTAPMAGDMFATGVGYDVATAEPLIL